MRVTNQESPLYCSFCGMSQCDVAVMIQGVSANICDECSDACGEMVEQKRSYDPGTVEYNSWFAAHVK